VRALYFCQYRFGDVGQSTIPDGASHTRKPDLQGLWLPPWLAPLERPADAGLLVVSRSEADKLFEVLWAQFDSENQQPRRRIDLRGLAPRPRRSVTLTLSLSPPMERYRGARLEGLVACHCHWPLGPAMVNSAIVT
jgi:hypothetical protein